MQAETRSPEEMFELFLLGARRSAIRMCLLRAMLRGLVWNALPFSTVICARGILHLTLAQIFAAYAIAAVATATACVWVQRRLVASFAEILDERYQAEGRIASAAEFLRHAGEDPYKRLAISEAGYWIASRSEPQGHRDWPIEAYVFLPATALMYLACRLT